jgi:hypothetical protein
MRNAAGWALGMLGGVVLCGCEMSPRSPAVAPASPTVEAAIQAVGGREAWADVEVVSARAVVAVYDAKGSRYVDRQDQEIDFADGKIRAIGRTPSGHWRGRADLEGAGQVSGPLFGVRKDLRTLMVAALATMLHRAAGPLNFAFGPEAPRSESPARIAGEDLIRIGVGGDSRRAVAYYFHPKTKTLRYVTSGGDRAGATGTLTEYTYMRLPNGMAFPESIRVVRIGQHALIGPERVLEVDFSAVSIR